MILPDRHQAAERHSLAAPLLGDRRPPAEADVLARLRAAYGPARWAVLHTFDGWVAVRGKTETITAADPIRLRAQLGTPRRT